MTYRTLAALALMLAFGGCGSRAVLAPQQGASLPPKPQTARVAPTPEQLMTPDDQARPQRNDELLKNSQKRPVDRFDLPPPG